MTRPMINRDARERLAEPLRRLEQDMQAGVWRGCRPAFVRDGKIEGFPSFSMADLREIAEAAPALLSDQPLPSVATGHPEEDQGASRDHALTVGDGQGNPALAASDTPRFRCKRCGRDEIDCRANGCERGPCPMEFVG